MLLAFADLIEAHAEEVSVVEAIDAGKPVTDCRDQPDEVAADLAGAAFWNAGQNCTAGSRVLVDRSIKDELDVGTPFGGYETSGLGGRDKGLEALEQYTELTTIGITLR